MFTTCNSNGIGVSFELSRNPVVEFSASSFSSSYEHSPKGNCF